MKKVILFLSLTTMLITSCADDPKVKLTNPEAFAFTLDKGWEINATVQSSGFAQYEKENIDLYFTHIDYSINLYTPQDTILMADYGSVIDSTSEEKIEVQLETQIELDSGFSIGSYIVEFIVEDKYSSTLDTVSVQCVLE